MTDNNVDKILLHCPNWVGDLVMATPFLRTVRENNPHAHIAVMVRPQIRAVIEGLPYYDEVILYDSRLLDRKLKRKWKVSRELKKSGFRLSIILPNSFSSALISFMSGIPHRIGFRTDGRGFMLTEAIPPPNENGRVVPIAMVDRYLTLCRHLNYSISSSKTVIKFSQRARETVNNYYQRWGIDKTKPIVSIIPGASFGSSKCWLPENFAQVADELTERYGAQILILTGPGEEEIARRIELFMRRRPFNVVSEIISLENLKAIISDSALVVTNDTGPRHYAVALDTPAVVIMGPTDPRYTNYGMDKTRLLRKDLECSPCHLKVCPSDHRCMKGITGDRVVKACEDFLG